MANLLDRDVAGIAAVTPRVTRTKVKAASALTRGQSDTEAKDERVMDDEAEFNTELIETLVAVSDSLADDFDLELVLDQLIEACLRLVPGVEVSVSLAAEDGSLRIVRCSTDRAGVLANEQLKLLEGPVVESFQTGQECSVRVGGRSANWPRFDKRAAELGFSSLWCIPLERRDNRVGVLSIATVAGPKVLLHEALVRAFARSLAIGYLNRRDYLAAYNVSQQLQTALTSRVLIEQSKGAVAALLGVSVDEAFQLLRSYARGTSQQLNDVSRRVLDGSLTTHKLLNGRTTKVRRSPQRAHQS